MSKRPDNLGVTNGQLAECPSSPNCVSTQTGQSSKKMEPIPWSGDLESVKARLRTAIESIPRTEIITDNENYFHAESTSLICRFVDDVEIVIDESNHLIHFRSASRIGHSDLGVNRKRMEKIRRAFESAGR